MSTTILYTGKNPVRRHEKINTNSPSDNILFFDNCVLLNKNDDNTIGNLTATEWEIINVKLKVFFKTNAGKTKTKRKTKKTKPSLSEETIYPYYLADT
jgi:hypothetical protein